MDTILFLLFSFALSAGVTAIAVKAARGLSLLSHPVERSSHSIPTPQVGGVGICAAFLVALMVLPILARHGSGAELAGGGDSVGGMVAPRAMLILMILLGFGIGLLDDIYHYSASKKIGGLLLLAAVPLGWGISLDGFRFEEFDGWSMGVVLGGILAVGWIFFFVNAYNFMDGANGQSGLFALNALGWWLVFWTMRSEYFEPPEFTHRYVLFLSIGLGGAILGFLVWNFPKAMTFMGDSGSLPLGAILAVLPLTLAANSLDLLIAHGMPLLLFVYDVLYTLVRRLKRRENVFVAHRSHLYQRLLIATDWSHARLLAFHLPFFLLSGLVGFFYYTSMLGRPFTDEPAAISPFLSPAFARAATAAAAVGLVGVYTALVLTIEKSSKDQFGKRSKP